jgi:hypothetical protein
LIPGIDEYFQLPLGFLSTSLGKPVGSLSVAESMLLLWQRRSSLGSGLSGEAVNRKEIDRKAKKARKCHPFFMIVSFLCLEGFQ